MNKHINSFNDFINVQNAAINVTEFVKHFKDPFLDMLKFIDSFPQFKKFKSDYIDYEADVYEIPLNIFKSSTGWDIQDIKTIGNEFHPYGGGAFYYNPARKTVNLQLAP